MLCMASGDGVAEICRSSVTGVQTMNENENSRPFKAYFDFMADVDDDGFDGESPLIRRMADDEVIMSREKQPKILKDQYIVGSLLGDGAYAKVKECVDMTTQQALAVKIIAMRSLRKMRGARQLVDQEARIMASLKHDNVIHLIDEYYDPRKDKRYFFLERCLGSIHDLQARGLSISAPLFRRLGEPQAHSYFAQTLLGIRYLHSCGVIHKDLKPGNLLLTFEENVKITDFGVSEQLDDARKDDNITSDQGTPAILPPEVASGNATSFSGFKVDVYGAGVCLYFMLLGRVPYRDPNVMRILQLIDEGNFELPDGAVSRPVADLIRAMMERDPDRRLSVPGVLSDPWVITAKPRPTSPEDKARLGWLEPSVYLGPEANQHSEETLADALHQLQISDANDERRRGLNSLGIFEYEEDITEEESRHPPCSPPPSSRSADPITSKFESRRSSRRSSGKKRRSFFNCRIS